MGLVVDWSVLNSLEACYLNHLGGAPTLTWLGSYLLLPAPSEQSTLSETDMIRVDHNSAGPCASQKQADMDDVNGRCPNVARKRAS